MKRKTLKKGDKIIITSMLGGHTFKGYRFVGYNLEGEALIDTPGHVYPESLPLKDYKVEKVRTKHRTLLKPTRNDFPWDFAVLKGKDNDCY